MNIAIWHDMWIYDICIYAYMYDMYDLHDMCVCV